LRTPLSPPEANTFELSSDLGAGAADVWAHAIDFSGINHELMPLMRMTAPREWKDLTVEQIRPGQKLFRSWLLLFGLLPIEYDDLVIEEIEPGQRFLERSRMLNASTWEHERIVTATGDSSCRLTDRIRFEPRWPAAAIVLRRTVPLLFGHRHRRLRRRFGSVA
jgi:hypothetical protein